MAELGYLLVAAQSTPRPPRRALCASLREGFAREADGEASALSAPRLLELAQRDACEPPAPLLELLRGRVAVRAFGFPDTLLPWPRAAAGRASVAAKDSVKLHELAELEMAEFEAKGWTTTEALPSSHGGASRPLFVRLADVYELPTAQLTVSSVRDFARSIDQDDPLARVVRTLRDDVYAVFTLQSMCALHPFNSLRILRMGAIHTLCHLLSDNSLAIIDNGRALPAVRALTGCVDEDLFTHAELSALALIALSTFRPVRRFLVSWGVFDLLTAYLKNPTSDRQTVIYMALLVRLCRDPKDRCAAAVISSPVLAEAMLQMLPFLPGRLNVADSLFAAAASLSPFLPTALFRPILARCLEATPRRASSALPHFACSFARSLKDSSELGGIAGLVFQILELLPPERPNGTQFHAAAGALLALCPHTTAISSFARPWLAASATAVLNQALRSGPRGLAAVRTYLPLARWDEGPAARAAHFSEVEAEAALWATRSRDVDVNCSSVVDEAASSPLLGLRRERFHGQVQMLRLRGLAETPHASLFHERPQLRIIVRDSQAEILIAFGLLPVTHCPRPVAACGCRFVDAKNDEGCGGQVGLWLCEFPRSEELGCEAVYRRHQLDLQRPSLASASGKGQTEHFASVVLPRGVYTLVPFSSHEMLACPPEEIQNLCRDEECGCVDLNLIQADTWDRGSCFASIGVWSECEGFDVTEASPWYLRCVVDGNLLAQSVPIWLASCVEEPIELLVYVCSSSGDRDDAVSLKESNACLDLWPDVPHRRARNERTGGQKIYVPKMTRAQPLRVTCLWQELFDPTTWSRPSPRLLVYASGELNIHLPPPFPSRSLGDMCCASFWFPSSHWQATALLSGGWACRQSVEEADSLRNPQIFVEVLQPPRRDEECQLDIYMSVSSASASGVDKGSPKGAFMICARVDADAPDAEDGVPRRLSWEERRKELCVSTFVSGGQSFAQLVLSGEQARSPFFIILRNTEPHEQWSWQLRILARNRPCSYVSDAPSTPSGAAQAMHGQGMSNGEDLLLGGARLLPDEPPLRVGILGAQSISGRIYVSWPDGLAAYLLKHVPKYNAGLRKEFSASLRGSVSNDTGRTWLLDRRECSWKSDDLHIRTSLGAVQSAWTGEGHEDPCEWPDHKPTVSAMHEDAGSVPPSGAVAVFGLGRVLAQTKSQAEAHACSWTPEGIRAQVTRASESQDWKSFLLPLKSSARDALDIREPNAVPSSIARSARYKHIECIHRRRTKGYQSRIDASCSGGPSKRVLEGCALKPLLLQEGDASNAGQNAGAAAAVGSSATRPLLPSLTTAARPDANCDIRQKVENLVKGPHEVRLELISHTERLGFGNTVGGPPGAKVLIVNWIRDGALCSWNGKAPPTLRVPIRSAIVAVNGVSGDVARMREELRSRVVDLEVITPDHCMYAETIGSTSSGA